MYHKFICLHVSQIHGHKRTPTQSHTTAYAMLAYVTLFLINS